MRNFLLIAKREYLQQVRGRAFKLSTILLPLGIMAMLGATYFTGRNAHGDRHIAIACDSAPLAEDMRRQLLEDKNTKYTVDLIAPATEADLATLPLLIRNKSVDGVMTIEHSLQGAPVASYTSQASLDFGTSGYLKYVLNRSLLEQRLGASGLKPAQAEALMKEVPVETLEIDKQGKSAKTTGMAAFTKAMVMAFMLTMPILLYGMDTARSIIDEKSSRIFEVMLAVCSPEDLLTGKLLGVGAVGLTQVAIWVGAAALLTGSALAAPLLSGNFSLHFSTQEAVLFPVYYVLGFFLYSSLFSGFASTCETAQELQMFMPVAVGPVWLSFAILPFLLNNPDSVWAKVLSFIPFTSPFVMLPRVGLQAVPIWEIGVSVGLLAVSIWGTLWLSSRLYRIGILMYGKRATLPEIVRWVRYS
jgi:ABC-2 type transport system permease protein